MEHLKVKLVEQYKELNFFQLSHRINKSCIKWGEDFIESAIERADEEYKHLVPKDGFDLILIGDFDWKEKTDKIDRIVYPAVFDGKDYRIIFKKIDGVSTILGYFSLEESKEFIKPYDYYLKRIAEVNGYVYDPETDYSVELREKKKSIFDF